MGPGGHGMVPSGRSETHDPSLYVCGCVCVLLGAVDCWEVYQVARL